MSKRGFEAPWQSFVDCISTVLVVVIFFAIILSILVAILSYSMAQRELEKSAAATSTVQSELAQPSAQHDPEKQIGEEQYIILFEGLESKPTKEIIADFTKWANRNNPKKKRRFKITQYITLKSMAFTDRRTTSFRRYYFMAKIIKNELKNEHVIDIMTVIQGNKEENKLIISFS